MKNKGTSEKRGISLIVLVITIIVIIILAVAVILSIANNNPIENAKEARFRNDMKVIEEELNLYIAKKYADDLGNSTEVVNLDGENMVKALPSTKDYKDKVKIVGGNLELTGSASDEEKDWAKKIGIKAPITFDRVDKTKVLAIGSEVTASNGEPFYVIGEDTVGTTITTDSTKDILLLAKYNLTSDGTSQDTTGESDGSVFCSSDVWNNANVPLDCYDLNNIETFKSDTTSAVGKALAYGKTFGGIGKLMRYDEVRKLQAEYSDIAYGTYTKKGYLNYWIASIMLAHDKIDGVMCVERGRCDSDTYYSNFTTCVFNGVRPVIEVPKSLIK